MFTLLRLIFFPAKVGVGTAKVGMKTGYRAGRLVGYRRLFVLGTGVAIGLLVAPVTGRELRSAIRRRIEARGVTDAELLERVRFELAHHPRTWHLPQPEVTVFERRVRLRGEIPDDAARNEMLRAAGALAGVGGVEDRYLVPGTAAAV
jgi:hypothetical protein